MSRVFWFRAAARVPGTIALAACAACHPPDGMFQPVRAESIRDAGSVHLSVLSVAPWSEYVAALTPDFNLSADAALAQVTADSRWMVQDQVRAARLGRQPVIVDRSIDPDTGVTTGVGQVFYPPGEDGEAHRYGAWPEDYRRVGEGEVLNGGDTPPATGPDAMLKYTAATALFQEVQLLNRYIHNAAIPDGFRPYVVRLQVSLMPSRRHAPYDAYTTLSFFIPGQRGIGPEYEGDQPYPSLETRYAIPDSPFGNGPKVLPLLVTDNLEATVQSRSVDTALSLYLGSLNFGGSGFAEPLYEALVNNTLRNEVYGRDLNSLLTLARLSENTLRIRLGAMQETTANYAMVPRNHNITLLLMVPQGAPPLMEVVSKTVLVDATRGEPLTGSGEIDGVALQRSLGREWRARDLDTQTIGRLVGFARRNDQRAFTSLLERSLDAGHPIIQQQRAFWIELVSFMVGNEYNAHLFELPGQGDDPDEASQVFLTQTVVAEDDGSVVRVVLREARLPEFEQVLAVLTLAPEPEVGDDDAAVAAPPDLVLLAQSVQIDSARRELRLSFPSLTRLQLVTGTLSDMPFKLRLSWARQTLVFDVRHREVSPFDSR